MYSVSLGDTLTTATVRPFFESVAKFWMYFDKKKAVNQKCHYKLELSWAQLSSSTVNSIVSLSLLRFSCI